MATNIDCMLVFMKVGRRALWPIVPDIKNKIGRKANSHIKLGNTFCAGDHAFVKWNGAETVELFSLDDNTFAEGKQIESGSSVMLKIGSTVIFFDKMETYTLE